MSQLTKAALAGLVLGVASQHQNANAEMTAAPSETEKCFGINSCKGTASCSVSKADIEAANVTFKNKFSKSKIHSCAGANACSAKNGRLDWLPVAKGTCLKIEGGFLIEDKDGKKIVKQKS